MSAAASVRRCPVCLTPAVQDRCANVFCQNHNGQARVYPKLKP